MLETFKQDDIERVLINPELIDASLPQPSVVLHVSLHSSPRRVEDDLAFTQSNLTHA
jgi:hypothetical protein